MKFWPIPICAFVVGLSLLLGLTTAAVAGNDDEKDRRVREITESINSPFCPATTLATCGSANAAEWRTEIRQWVDDGLTKNEICARLEQRVQHKLCVGPRRPWMWSLPFLIAAASLGLLAFVLRRFVRPGSEDEASDEDAEPSTEGTDLDERLDRELESLDD